MQAAIAAMAMLMMVTLFAACGEREGAGERESLKVVAEIVPLADFCREVGGGLVEVETLVPPGATPHAYELTSAQMRFLEEAAVVVVNGLDLTPWAEDVFSKAGNPAMIKIVAAEAVPLDELIGAAGHGGTGGEDSINGIYDPHIWLNPQLAMDIVEAIRDGMSRADPENAASYSDNAERYISELARLDDEIEEKTASFSARKFIAFHSTWTYFAHRYGLEQVGVIEELPGKEPSAGEIAELVEIVRAQGVKVIFAEPQFSARAAEAIAEESGGEIEVRMLDPLGDPGSPESDTYLKMMRKNVQIMQEALQ